MKKNKKTQIKDLIPIKNEIIAYANEANLSEIDNIFKKLLEDSIASTDNPDDGIIQYNSILALFDDIKAQAAHDGVCASHSLILRRYCAEQRKQPNPASFEALVDEHFVAFKPNTIQIAGIRKSIRIDTNIGILTPYLTGKEAEYAIMGAGTWGAISSHQIIDIGFVFSCGTKKFDIYKTGALNNIDDTIHTLNGITPKEFATSMRFLLKSCLKNYGENTTKNLILETCKEVIKQVNIKIGNSAGEMLKTYASKYCSTHINVNEPLSEKWLPWLLATKDNIFAEKNAIKIPHESNIELGLELLYPIIPIFSKEWINKINDPNIINSGLRIGFIDLAMAYRALYDCSNEIKIRFLSYHSCSFAVSGDQDATDKISASSISKKLTTSYMWKYSDASSKETIEFNLDDLLTKKVFPANGIFVVHPNHVSISNTPNSADTYQISMTSDSNVLPRNFEVNSIFAIIKFNSNKNKVPIWGIPLTKDEAIIILPYLDFLPGQEIDDKQMLIMCKLTKKPINTIQKAIMSKKHLNYIVVATQQKWI